MSYEMEVVNIRLVNEPSWYSKEPLDNPDKIARFMSEELRSFDREVFCILNLTTDAKVINMNIVSMGTLNASLVSAREVFKSSILSNAASIIAVHNHPSGNLYPSQNDMLITNKLMQAGELLGIELLDHIIVGGGKGEYYSFHTHNLLLDKELQQKQKGQKTMER